jgi:hypothetical protein
LAGPRTAILPRRWGTLAILLLACLLPRAWEAWKWDVLWNDTLLYLHSAEALEEGNRARAFNDLNLNTYPVILLGLRRLGIDWVVAGEAWSVLMATAAVLPLWGWIRRQFDDQVALVGCLLYALQPTLVAFTPLIIRDPTFWFLMNLSLYLAWRAIIEIRWWLFLTAGTALTLAIHTRVEGWLLLVPLAMWWMGRVRNVPGMRRRLTLGTFSSLAIIPLSLALVNVTWLRDCPRWGLIRGTHSEIATHWLHALVAPKVAPAPSGPPLAPAQPEAAGRQAPPPAAEDADEPNAHLSGWTLLRKLGTRIMKTYSYSFGLIALLGVWGWRRVYARMEHQAMLWMSVLLAIAIWIRYTRTEIDIRYILPIVMVSFSWMALGLLWGVQWLVWLTDRFRVGGPKRRAALTAAMIVIVAALGLPDMKLHAAPAMRRQATVGRWILGHLGPRQTICGGPQEMVLLAYYAQGRSLKSFDPLTLPAGRLPPQIEAEQPGVILLWNEPANHAQYAAWAAALAAADGSPYRCVASDRLPPDCDVVVLVRRDRGAELGD